VCDVVPDCDDSFSDVGRVHVQARDFVQLHTCPEHGRMAMGALLLLTGELVDNAAQHGQPPITVRLSCLVTELLLTVGDAGDALPTLLESTAGLGLRIVAQNSRDWGTTPSARGKEVWCRIPTGMVTATVPAPRADTALRVFPRVRPSG